MGLRDHGQRVSARTSEVVAKLDMRAVFTTRTDWTRPGESAWSSVAKFQWLNRLTWTQLYEALGTCTAVLSSEGVDLRCGQHFDMARLAAALRLDTTTLRQSFCVTKRHEPIIELSAEILRFCPACIAQGYHATLFQFEFVRRCPIHAVVLSRACPRCGEPMAYRCNAALVRYPYACGACRQVLYVRVNAPRLRGLEPRIDDERLFDITQWRQYIAVIIELNGGATLKRPRSADGCFVPDILPTRRPMLKRRFAFVRDFQERFREPPPLPNVADPSMRMPLEGLTRRRDAGAVCSHHGLERNWPHLPADYDRYARLYRRSLRQRKRILGDVGQLSREQKGDSATLTLPFSVQPEWVALLGWQYAWEGKMPCSESMQLTTLPLFGLLEWWALAPLRPTAVPPWLWRRALLRQFAQDLRDSFAHWLALARWMQARNAYMVHPRLFSPGMLWIDLAAPERVQELDPKHRPDSHIFTSI